MDSWKRFVRGFELENRPESRIASESRVKSMMLTRALRCREAQPPTMLADSPRRRCALMVHDA